MAIVIVETLSDTPLTPDEPTDNDYQLLSCLEERSGQWRYSLLSRDRLRMICTFEAPDAETVRESYRRTNVPFNQVWSGSILKPDSSPVAKNAQTLTVWEGVYPGGITEDQWQSITQAVLPLYTEHGVEWVQSYVASDRSRIVCELNTAHPDALNTVHQQIGVSLNRVWPAMMISTE